MERRIYRSKYRFSTLEVGDTIKVAASDYGSMKNSLRFHNKTHGRDIAFDILEEKKIGETRVSLILKRVK